MLFTARTSHLKRALRTGGSAPPPPPPPVTGPVNVALAANGGVATASSTYNQGGGFPAFPPSAAINGDRRGTSWGGIAAGQSGWNDATPNSWPDWLQVDFAVAQPIDTIDVFSVQDGQDAPGLTPPEPTAQMTFTQIGVTAFTVQYWNGSTWVTVSGGSITGNNLVWRRINFPAVTTTAIRITVTAALNVWSRIAEVEAWTASTVNVVPPIVNITSPTNNQRMAVPANVAISATITPTTQTGGVLSRVEILKNDVVIHTFNPAVGTLFEHTDPLAAAGLYTYKVKAYDDTNSLTTEKTSAVNAVDESTLSNGNWESRIAGSGVIFARPLESAAANDANLAGRFTSGHAVGIYPGAGTNPRIDTTIKPPGGAGSLAFDVAAQGGADTSGAWYANLSGTNYSNDPPTIFFRDVGDEFWLQWLYYVTESWITNPYRTTPDQDNPDGGWIGRKIMDVVSGDIAPFTTAQGLFFTSDLSKLVLDTDSVAGQSFPKFYNYDQGGGTQQLVVDKMNGDRDLQPRGALDYVSLFDVIQHVHTYIPPQARAYLYPEEWLQFKAHFKIVGSILETVDTDGIPAYRRQMRTRLYGGRTGETPRLAFDLTHGQWIKGNGWPKVHFFPYLTNRRQDIVYEPATVYVSRVIASTNDIPDALEISVNWTPTWLQTIKANPATLNVFTDIPGTAPSAATGMRPLWSTEGEPLAWEARTISDYCGMACDETRGEIFLAAHGGHASTGQNGVYGILLATNSPAWRVVRESTEFVFNGGGQAGLNEDMTENGVAYFVSDGRPTSRHTYYNEHVVDTPTGRKIVLPMNKAATVRYTDNGPGPPNAADAFNLETGDWDIKAGITWQAPSTYFANIEPSVVDRRTGKIYCWREGGQIDVLDTTTRTRSNLSYTGYDNWGVSFVGMCLDYSRNQLVISGTRSEIAGGQRMFGVLNLTTNAYRAVTLTGAGTSHMQTYMQEDPSSALTHDTINDVYLWMGRNAGKIVAVQPNESSSWNTTVVCDSPGGFQGIFNRFEFIEGFGGAVLLGGGTSRDLEWTSNIKFLRRI